MTAALLVRFRKRHDKYVDDPLGEALDVIGMNEYIGWYEQLAAGRGHDGVACELSEASNCE